MRATLYSIGDAVISTNANGCVMMMNPVAEKLNGWSEAEARGRPLEEVFRIVNEETREEVENPVKRILREGVVIGLANHTLLLARNGCEYPIADAGAPIRDATGSIAGVVLVFRDQTAERAAQRAVQEARLLAESIIATVREPLVILDANLRVVSANHSFYQTFRVTPKETEGHFVYDLGNRQWNIPALRRLLEEILPQDTEVANWEVRHDFEHIGKRIMLLNARHVLRESDKTQFILLAIEDITERKRAEEKIQRQLKQFAALREIDRAITSSFDPRLALNVLLSHAVGILGVEAADILKIDLEKNPAFKHVASLGFLTDKIQTMPIWLANSHAGQVVRERSAVKIPRLAARSDLLFLDSFIQEEGFTSYCGVPLIVKGKVIGVMEVFERSTREHDQEWLDFLHVLAGQAAIAIDNARLFDELSETNDELIQAYDATIEGWSRAMDLRHRETEGHIQRVTELTLKLAARMGIGEQEQVHIRRGVLLHNIGKLGVPDHILLKPGPLTDEEWNIMRQHPVHAYNMLMPIAYLHPALDIPYCHHEKWDGSGYPRGLKGEQIPLAARIFAVVDVWDVLRSDRPYRTKWSSRKALDHIRGQAGKHFDPKVVEVFLSLLQNK